MRSTRWLLTLMIVGGPSAVGLFTRLAAVVEALFLLSIICAQPPWLADSLQTFTYNQTVEMLALLVLACVGAGRWGGLDFFLSRCCTGCCSSKKGTGTAREASCFRGITNECSEPVPFFGLRLGGRKETMNLTPEDRAIGKENFETAIGSEHTRRDFLQQGIAAGHGRPGAPAWERCTSATAKAGCRRSAAGRLHRHRRRGERAARRDHAQLHPGRGDRRHSPLQRLARFSRRPVRAPTVLGRAAPA